MFWNNFKITLRSFLKQKKFTLIILTGLTLGLSACLFITVYVIHEKSYDHFWPKANQLVRVPMTWHFGETSMPSGSATSEAGVMLKEELPEVLNFTRIRPGYGIVLKKDDKLFEEKEFVYADTAIISMFDLHLVKGNPETALKEPNSLVLTVSLAEKYFGANWNETNVIGTSLLVNNQTNYLITGIVEDLPDNTHIQFSCIGSFASLNDYENPNWDNSEFATYALLTPEAAVNPTATIDKFTDLITKKFGAESVSMVQLHMEPITDVYLYSEFHNALGKKSDIRYLYIFSAIGLLILIMACINYVNMTTALSLSRAKEVGIKKVAGAQRDQLFWQFMIESGTLIFSAFFLAILLLFLLKDWFKDIASVNISTNLLIQPEILLPFVGLSLFMTFLSGIYPAIVLSGFRPIIVLKGRFSYSNQGKFLRKTLVIVQFSISMFLLAFTFVIFRQMQLIQDQNLGYEKEHTIILPTDKAIQDKKDVIRNDLLKISGVKNVTFASRPPINITSTTTVKAVGDENERQLISYLISDENYIETFDLQVLTGKDFQEITYPDSALVFMVNEAAMKFFGWSPENVIGQELQIWGRFKGEIIGVVKDFNFQSLKQNIEPLVMVSSKKQINFGYNLMVKLNKEANTPTNLTQIQQTWNKHAAHYPFDYHFMDEAFDRLYKSEQYLSELFVAFSIIAVIIAFLGLTGLAAFNTRQRYKEISIRKVLGANISGILVLLSKDYLWLLLTSFAFALPVSHYFVTEWLDNFAYKIDATWWVYALPAFTVIITAILAIIFQSLKAVNANPAQVLKNE
ncbi:ABC transporter permease [Chondrinema litorale]|uniref:ABC transporter permease n=1 Tax=Chondrinema litorale TaxID=2994555 RepID=UPI002544745A|nr:ABC transporter permease [Chondrinema litorale]UZR94812.1 ABC transporter permease [Chondrinema litorale]